MVVNASWKDIHHLDGPQGLQHQMIGTLKGLPHDLTPLECHYLGHLPGDESGYFHVLPPHWCGGIKGRAAYHRYVAHLMLFIQREKEEGGTNRSLPHRTRHVKSAPHLTRLRWRPRVIFPGEWGLPPTSGGIPRTAKCRSTWLTPQFSRMRRQCKSVTVTSGTA